MEHPNINTHIELLREKVFQLKRWPHYGLLLDDLMELANNFDAHFGGPAKIMSYERTLLYGGKSVFAPIFHAHQYDFMEQSPASATDRGAYNAHMVADPRFKNHGTRYEGGFYDPTLKRLAYDLVLIPNALHHTSINKYGQKELLLSARDRLKMGGYLYIYEQFIEDYHQMPDDYVRYTPAGLETLLLDYNFEIVKTKTTGGIFSSICYLLDTAVEYVQSYKAPDLEHGFAKAENIKRLYGMIKRLSTWDEMYPTNTVRPESSCPKAFSVLARVPTLSTPGKSAPVKYA